MADRKPAANADDATVTTEQRLDETIEGGRYLNADGVLVNAKGEEIDANGKVKQS
jgi:hypothetical protein